ncbi:MAG: chemotaxis response regulator protein-glutamate methylesterase [Uliginosibacterium sp.]|nr:chemotaxis response regulator protein-glutamate methylesterase [Uliginosibacterium sp.]
MKIRVLVVDDSALMRAVLSEVINARADMQVVGVAKNALEAQESIKSLSPDVMTLDVDMPHVNGLDFLAQVMKQRPMPVIMVSSLTERGSETTLRALELGAVDFVPKPKIDPVGGIKAYADELCDKIRAAKLSNRRALPPEGSKPVERTPTAETLPPLSSRILQERLVMIGASTGGTEAIKEVLTGFPEKMPGIMIVQHMPEMFTGSFAKRLDGLCKIRVKEAEDGESIKPGVAYIAPGHSHLSVQRSATGFSCELSRAEPVNRHRPSVDVLFNSAARVVGAQGLGVMLTGMGKDGAMGMLAMRKAGAYNICQDQQSCVVWGMPREATINGAAHEVVALAGVAGRVLARLRAPDSRS